MSGDFTYDGRCKHYKLERFYAPNFDKRKPYPIFLFWCKTCGRTLAKQILEVTTIGGVRMKEVRCILPYEFQPWREIIDMDNEREEQIVNKRAFGKFDSHLHKEIIEEKSQNGSEPIT